MLTHPTLDKLQSLRLTGMVHALSEQLEMPDIDQLSFEDRLGLLVDREMTERSDRQLKTRLRQASYGSMRSSKTSTTDILEDSIGLS